MEVLEDAEFPEDYVSIEQIVALLVEMAQDAHHWSTFSSTKKKYSLSTTGVSNAVKYARLFKTKLDLLDKLISQLVSSVTVDSYKGTKEMKEILIGFHSSFSEQTGFMQNIGRDVYQLQADLTEIGKEQRCSELRIKSMVKEALQYSNATIDEKNMNDLKCYFEVMQEGIGVNKVQTDLLVRHVQELLQQQQQQQVSLCVC